MNLVMYRHAGCTNHITEEYRGGALTVYIQLMGFIQCPQLIEKFHCSPYAM